MLDFIAFPLGKILLFIYDNLAFHYYGLAIIIFTLFIRLLLLPLYIKQYHSTARLQEIQPQIQDIQKKYKNDKEKLNQELMKVYKDNNVNPAGGCLPTLLQMPILFSLFYVIQSPLKYMYQIGTSAKALIPGRDMVGVMKDAIETLFKMLPKSAQIGYYKDLSIIHYFTDHKDLIASTKGLLKEDFLLNMNFFGLNLGLKPTYDINIILHNGQYLALILVPILAAFTTWLTIKLSTLKTPKTQSGGPQMATQMTGSMMVIMPVMIAVFAFSVPAGMGLYWITGNVVQVFQQLYINKYVLKKKA